MKGVIFSENPNINKSLFPSYEKRKDVVLQQTWIKHIKDVANLNEESLGDLGLQVLGKFKEQTESNKALILLVCKSFLAGKHFGNDGKSEQQYRQFLYE